MPFACRMMLRRLEPSQPGHQAWTFPRRSMRSLKRSMMTTMTTMTTTTVIAELSHG